VIKIRVLGCHGSIGLGFYTSSYLINNHILLDAGTGVGQLTLDEMSKIEHVLLTHAHMDHIACLPLIIDTTITSRKKPLTIWASKETISSLKQHIFNNQIWPDFSAIPSIETPFLNYQPIHHFEQFKVIDVSFRAIPVIHTIPTVAFEIESDAKNKFILCGDTGVQDEFWHYVNRLENLKGIAIETAFGDGEIELAHTSKHLSPLLLIQELNKLQHKIPIYVMHLKPGQTEIIIRQLIEHDKNNQINLLFSNEIIEF
jgi:cAMP phosphodiesterase